MLHLTYSYITLDGERFYYTNNWYSGEFISGGQCVYTDVMLYVQPPTLDRPFQGIASVYYYVEGQGVLYRDGGSLRDTTATKLVDMFEYPEEPILVETLPEAFTIAREQYEELCEKGALPWAQLKSA